MLLGDTASEVIKYIFDYIFKFFIIVKGSNCSLALHCVTTDEPGRNDDRSCRCEPARGDLKLGGMERGESGSHRVALCCKSNGHVPVTSYFMPSRLRQQHQGRFHFIKSRVNVRFTVSNKCYYIMLRELVSELVVALSPVNHRGLHQG